MSFEDIKKLDDAYVMHTYGRYNLAIDHGKGAICYDPAGKSYIDFTSGLMEALNAGAYECNITCISMGNPHGVVFVDSVADIDIEKIGPKFENHPMFPDRVNTEFIELVDDKTIKMRVWERGAGETLACGTGACASAYASYLNKKTGKKVLVHLLGGDLQIEYDEEKDTIFMTGPATTVFDGEIDLTGIDD